MNDFPDRVIQRTRSYWYIDGLWEVAFGSQFILMGLFFFGQASAPPESMLSYLMNYAFLVIVIGITILASWAVRKAKERITYPRTGYIAYHRRPKGRRVWIVSVLIILLSILVGSVLYAVFQVWEPALDWLPFLFGFFGLTIFLPIAYINDLKRFYFLAIFSILLGIIFAWIGVTGWNLMSLYFGLLGIGLVVSGGITFWVYLNDTTPQLEAS